MEQEFELKSEYIELTKLLKLLQLVESGGQAGAAVNERKVYRNGKQELRKRAKLRRGDQIEFEGHLIRLQ